tara:strand:+ start:50 stop:325 length:276 start_codon:yes stop_codon:yes gene_type:complete
MQEQEKRNIIKKMTIQEKQLDEDLKKDLKKVEIKKDKALDKDPNVLKQIKIGLGYRKDQGIAILKDKSKKILNKGKNKIYGITDLLKSKIN